MVSKPTVILTYLNEQRISTSRDLVCLYTNYL